MKNKGKKIKDLKKQVQKDIKASKKLGRKIDKLTAAINTMRNDRRSRN